MVDACMRWRHVHIPLLCCSETRCAARVISFHGHRRKTRYAYSEKIPAVNLMTTKAECDHCGLRCAPFFFFAVQLPSRVLVTG